MFKTLQLLSGARAKIVGFLYGRPVLLFYALYILMPLLLLAALALTVLVVMAPIGWVLGWL